MTVYHNKKTGVYYYEAPLIDRIYISLDAFHKMELRKDCKVVDLCKLH